MNALKKKPGRPPIPFGNKKHSVVSIRLDDTELSLLESASELLRIPRTEVVRYFLFESLKPIQPLLEHHVDEESPKFHHAVLDLYRIQRHLDLIG